MMTFWSFLQCLPELIALFRTLEGAAKEAETKRKVQEDIKTIHGAFIDKNPDKLNALFLSK
jgi:hypothetical protein